MTTLNNSLSEAFADIIKPIVKEAVRQALNINSRDVRLEAFAGKGFLTVKEAAAYSGLGSSTIRLYMRKRQIKTHKVGRRVLIKRTDLEAFLESNPIQAMPDKFLT
jgi:excisionase family DNA binding protein